MQGLEGFGKGFWRALGRETWSDLGFKRVTLAVQFSSVTRSCLILCDTTDCSLPGFPVLHQLLELAQTHVH